MAFQQPQRQQAPRLNIYTFSPPQPSSPVQAEQYKQSPQQSREWILFSPDSPSVTEARTVSTARTPRTAGRSHLSELGSLATAAASECEDEEDGREDEETEDMDSLDDGLHAFHEHSAEIAQQRKLEHSTDTVLPSHDGLGTFPGNSNAVQEKFWQHERHNPRRTRHSLRRSSLQLRSEMVDQVQEHDVEDERFQRIEKWRADQSRAILEEIEKETRRRRRKDGVKSSTTRSEPPSTASRPVSIPTAPQATPLPPSSPETESFWERFTRRVIHDLMGFDDATLSLMFGEELAEPESTIKATDIIKRAEQEITNGSELTRMTGSWEERLLARIAKELGILVNQLSDHHPGAFSTYLRTQEPAQYAGLPTPPMDSSSNYLTNDSSATPTSTLSNSDPQFIPTLAHRNRTHRHSAATTDPSLWGIEEETDDDPTAIRAADTTRIEQEREYWGRDLDVKMVFGFLRDRLSPSSQPTSSGTAHLRPSPSARATVGSMSNNQPNSLRRAALIRHHHPLVSRNVAAAASASREQQVLAARRVSAAPLSPVLGRRQGGSRGDESITSCASQSTKRSKTARSGSSRNYWDVGAESVGSGGWSAGWGEV